MERSTKKLASALGALALLIAGAGPAGAQQVDICGCTGSPDSLGAFDSNDAATWPPGTTQVVNQQTVTIPLSAGVDGVLIFDSFRVQDVPGAQSNGIIRFAPDAGNNPVTLLVAGDVFIDASDSIDVSGQDGTNGTSGAAGLGGAGGPGGFRGGDGAYQLVDALLRPTGGTGLGPRGGLGFTGGNFSNFAEIGGFLGVPTLLPMIGGSGGGGGGSSANLVNCSGGGGGGGGGAILIAANGTLTVNGAIRANGGDQGTFNTSGSCSSYGGGGGGGAIRLLANAIVGSGSLSAQSDGIAGPADKDGAIRMEAFTNTFPGGTSATPPASRVGAPGPIRNPLEPSVRISQISGVNISLTPAGITGGVDVIVPAPGPVTVQLTADGVPAGTNVEVTAKGNLGGGDLAPQAVLLAPGGCDSAGQCIATAVFDMAAGQYIVEARATFTTN